MNLYKSVVSCFLYKMTPSQTETTIEGMTTAFRWHTTVTWRESCRTFLTSENIETVVPKDWYAGLITVSRPFEASEAPDFLTQIQKQYPDKELCLGDPIPFLFYLLARVHSVFTPEPEDQMRNVVVLGNNQSKKVLFLSDGDLLSTEREGGFPETVQIFVVAKVKQ